MVDELNNIIENELDFLEIIFPNLNSVPSEFEIFNENDKILSILLNYFSFFYKYNYNIKTKYHL